VPGAENKAAAGHEREHTTEHERDATRGHGIDVQQAKTAREQREIEHVCPEANKQHPGETEQLLDPRMPRDDGHHDGRR
jgi:hypothetical protein